MEKIKRPLLIITLLSFTLSSCGVMFGGSRYSGTIVVKDHPDADIVVNGNRVGTGSAIGLYKRDRPLIVEVREDGCESKTQHFDNTFRTGNFIASLLMWDSSESSSTSAPAPPTSLTMLPIQPSKELHVYGGLFRV